MLAFRAKAGYHGRERGKEMPFAIIHGDITQMDVDAIVNAANTDLAMGGGVCGAIFNAAGVQDMQEACAKVAPIKTGEAAITPGFCLKARHVIHAAGPVYSRWDAGQNEKLLTSSYTESLRLATENGLESIAFPLISSGIYGYPKEEALRVALQAIKGYLQDHDMDVYLVVFDASSFIVSEKLLEKVNAYIGGHYAAFPAGIPRNIVMESDALNKRYQSSLREEKSIEEMVDNLDEPFSCALLRLIAEKGMTDVEVYKKANIDRKLFSKIRTGKGYMPGKRTILALAVALQLTLDETDDLLERAGYALSHSQKSDVIIEYFIVNRRYDVFEINEVLFAYDQPLLGL